MNRFFLRFVIANFFLLLLVVKSQLVSRLQICSKGQYDSIDTFCNQCIQSACTQCIQAYCLQCQIGSQIQEQTQQITCLQPIKQCQIGYYFDLQAKSCFKCQIPACKSCKSSSYCHECQDGFQLLNNSVCILKQIFQSNIDTSNMIKNSLQKAILGQGQSQIKYVCPNTYLQIQESKNCQQMDACSSILQENISSFQDDIIDFIVNEQTQQRIIISSKQIGIYNSIDMKLVIWLLDLSQVDKNGSQDEEVIMNAIQIKNILNVFTNYALYIFSIISQTIINKIEFQQNSYNFEQKMRFYISQDGYLYYLFQNNQHQDGVLLVAQFQITQKVQTINGQDYVDEKNYSIKLQNIIPFNTLPQGIFSINYSQYENIVLITRQNQMYTIFIGELFRILKNQSTQINDQYIQKFIVINNLDIDGTPLKLDQVYQNESHQFIIYRVLNSQILVLKVSTDTQSMKVSIQYQNYDLPGNLEIQSLIKLKNQLSKLYEDVAIIGTKYNQDDQSFSIQISSIGQSISNNYKILNNIYTLTQILDINLISLQLDLTSNIFVVLQSQQQLLIGILENNSINIILNYMLGPMIQFQLKTLCAYAFQKTINDNKQYFRDICLTQSNLIVCFRTDTQNKFQVKQSQYQLGYDNQIQQVQYLALEKDCSLPCIQYTYLDQYSNLLIFLQNVLIVINYDNLGLANQIQYNSINEFQYPCFIITDNYNNVVVYQLIRSQLNILYISQNSYGQTQNFFLQNLQQNQNSQIFLIQLQDNYYNILIYSNGVYQLNFSFSQQIQFLNVESDLSFSILYYDSSSSICFKSYMVDLQDKKIVLHEDYENLDTFQNYPISNKLISNQNMRFLIIVTSDKYNNLFVLSLFHPLKQFLIKQQFEENLNLLSINNEISTLITKNLPNVNQSMQQIKSNHLFTFNKNWWVYDEYGIIITLIIDEINSEQIVNFQYLDNLEAAINPLKLKSSDQAFWFNNYETLIICSEKQIRSYQIQQQQLLLNYTYDYTSQINTCFQVFLNSFIFCSNQGAFDFLKKQFYEQSTQFNLENIFIENQKYIFFQPQVLFEISKGTFQQIQLNNIVFEVKNMMLSPYFNDQGFYVVPNQYCMIFSLPDFDTIVSYDLIDESNSYTCDFNPELSIYSIYSNETLSSYQFPVQYSGQTQQILKLAIPFNLQNYFSSNSYIFRKYFVSYKYFTRNQYDQYLFFLLIDIQSGEIIQINNFLYSGSQDYFIVDIWEEKDVILSNDILLSISDVSQALSFNKIQKSENQQISYSKNYNYIIYQANDSQSLISLDVSEIFPINRQIGQLSSRFNNYSINFYSVSNINEQQQQQYVELIYFNQQLSQLIIWKFISSNKATNQSQYLQYAEKQVFLDVAYIFNELIQYQKINKQAVQTQYKIFLLFKDEVQKIFAFYFKCQAVIFNQNQKILQIVDLEPYQCQLIISKKQSSPSLSNQQLEPQLIYLISQQQQQQSVTQIIYQNGNIVNENIYTEQQPDESKIQSLISISFEGVQVSVLIYNSFINKITILMKSQNIDSFKKFQFDQIQNIYSYSLEIVNKNIILFLGTEQNLLIQQIVWDQVKSEISLVKLNELTINQKGYSQLLYTLKYIASNSNFEQIMLILTTQKRIMLFQNSQNNILSFDLIRENLKHLRGQHQIQIHQNVQRDIQIMSLFSQLQVSFYSLPSLQFISRVEEKTSVQITGVHLIFSVEIVVIVCDQKEIQVFVLSRFNKEKKLLLQNSIKLSSATIYNVANMNQNMVVFHGANSRGYFIIYYSLSDNQIFQSINQPYSNQQTANCLNILSLQNKIQYQEIQFNQVIKQDNDSDSASIQISVDLSASMQIFIPKYMIYQNMLSQKKNFDYRINLSGFQGTPKQYSLDNYQKLLEKIQINNGILYIDSDIVFQDLNSFILENVIIRFCTTNCKFTILNVQEVIFENVYIIDQQIENLNRSNSISQDGQLLLNPLIKLQNCSSVLLTGIQIQNLKLEQDFFLFEDVQNIQVEKVRCQDVIIIGTLFSFRNQFKVLSQTTIENIVLRNNFIIQLFQILNVKTLNINNIQLQYINNKSANPTGIEIEFYQVYQKVNYSLIQITLVLDRAQITQLISRNQVIHQQLLDYKNYYEFNNETFSTQTSVLMIKNVYINQCFFLKYAIQITENSAHMQQIAISNTNNTSIILHSISKGLKIIDVKFTDNIFIENPILKISNSQAKLSKISFLRNKLVSLFNSLNSIAITNTTFLIDILSADKNISPSGFLFIDGVFNTNIDFLTSSQQNLINNCIIKYCNNNAVILKNLERLNIINSIFNYNSQEKQVDDGGAIQMYKVDLCFLQNTQVKNNFAKRYGGGISMEDSDIYIINSLIQYNYAVIGGGLRFFTQNNLRPLNLFKSQFKSQIIDNKAEFFGNNIASIPFKIKFLSNLENLKISLNQFSTSFTFQVFGVDGELIKYNKYTQRLMQEGQEFLNQYFQFELISDQKSVQIENQVRTYNIEKDYFNITCNLLDYGYTELLEIQDKNADFNEFYMKRRIIQLKVLSNPLYQIDFSISFQQCQEGQLILGLQQNLYQCYQCNENTYSIVNPYTNINTNKCEGCPVGAISCQGSKIQLEEGYWKQEGTYFVKYCYNKPQKCTQLVQPNELKKQQSNGCVEGGYGPLCESCDYLNIFWGSDPNDAYAKTSMYECINCKEVQIFDQFIKIAPLYNWVCTINSQVWSTQDQSGL
ncbi:hypothetical protein ABPG73_016687 [Tetrahymena malaccensis]